MGRPEQLDDRNARERRGVQRTGVTGDHHRRSRLEREKIVDIYRADALRPIAEAYQAESPPRVEIYNVLEPLRT